MRRIRYWIGSAINGIIDLVFDVGPFIIVFFAIIGGIVYLVGKTFIEEYQYNKQQRELAVQQSERNEIYTVEQEALRKIYCKTYIEGEENPFDRLSTGYGITYSYYDNDVWVSTTTQKIIDYDIDTLHGDCVLGEDLGNPVVLYDSTCGDFSDEALNCKLAVDYNVMGFGQHSDVEYAINGLYNKNISALDTELPVTTSTIFWQEKGYEHPYVHIWADYSWNSDREELSYFGYREGDFVSKDHYNDRVLYTVDENTVIKDETDGGNHVFDNLSLDECVSSHYDNPNITDLHAQFYVLDKNSGHGFHVDIYSPGPLAITYRQMFEAFHFIPLEK